MEGRPFRALWEYTQDTRNAAGLSSSRRAGKKSDNGDDDDGDNFFEDQQVRRASCRERERQEKRETGELVERPPCLRFCTARMAPALEAFTRKTEWDPKISDEWWVSSRCWKDGKKKYKKKGWEE